MTIELLRQPETNFGANRIFLEDSPVHQWYRFVLSYPPHLVRDYINRFGLTPEDRVLDPFCGTGTTIVECKKRGIASVGIEANPLAAFVSRVKVQWQVDPDGLMAHAESIACEANNRLLSQGIDDDPVLVPPLPPTCNELLRLSPEQERLLLANSISPLPLHKTMVLMDVMGCLHEETFSDYERLALANALPQSISNLYFGPEVGIGPPKADTPVVSVWLDQIRTIVRDLKATRCCEDVYARVLTADARELDAVLEQGSISAVITSPPYPNEKDYTRTTRLESVLLGFIPDRDSLRSLKRQLLRSNSRGIYKNDDDDTLVSGHSEINRIAEAIESKRIELGKTSGFERAYARVTKLYFGGMVKHLTCLRTVLRPGARLAYVVGDQASYLRVMIRTGSIIADLAESLGYEVVGIELFRTRLATATKEQMREEVVVLRWPG